MTATIDLTIQPSRDVEPVRPAHCPLAPRADQGDNEDGCKHPSGVCGPEGCSAC